MNEQLHKITSLLSEHGVRHWLDAGALLGTVRDGKLMEHDGDIDIGVWVSSMDTLLQSVIPALKTECTVEYHYLGPFLHKVLCTPHKKCDRKYDIQIYRRHEGHAWCPQICARQIFLLSKAVRQCNKWFPRTFRHQMGFWYTLAFGFRTWWIPCHFVEEPVQHSTGMFVPQTLEKYLEFRYGDWRTPKRDWRFQEDDGGLRRESPASLLKWCPSGKDA